MESLSTGIIGGPTINYHMRFEQGLKGMVTISNKTVNEGSLTVPHRVTTLAMTNNMTHVLNGDCLNIDSLLFFQRNAILFRMFKVNFFFEVMKN